MHMLAYPPLGLDGNRSGERTTMLLKSKATNDLVEILSVTDLANPGKDSVTGRSQAGQEEQNSENFPKSDLLFPSGESLPRCWIDADYRQN